MVLTDEVAGTSEVQVQGMPSTQLERIDHNHPLFIHSSDNQGSVLISVQLLGSENYSLWSKSLKLVLLGENKLGFMLGTCRKDMYPSSMHDLWDRCNAIVLGWIMNIVSKGLLAQSFMDLMHTQFGKISVRDLVKSMHLGLFFFIKR